MSDPQKPWEPHEPKRPPRQRPFLAWLVLLAIIGLGVWGLVSLFPGRIATWDDVGRLGGGLLWAAMAAALALSVRGNFGQMARYAAAWLGVVGVLALGYAYRSELKEAALRVRGELVPGYTVPSTPREMAVSQGPGGHFVVYAQVNGRPVRFLVDTGASAIVLSPADARRVGVDLDGLDYDQMAETANGVGRSAGFRADSLVVGDLRLEDVEMEINQAPMSVSLLGMDFFRRLDSFRVENGRLYMRWREGG